LYLQLSLWAASKEWDVMRPELPFVENPTEFGHGCNIKTFTLKFQTIAVIHLI